MATYQLSGLKKLMDSFEGLSESRDHRTWQMQCQYKFMMKRLPS
jgi:hypothetical protein